MLYVRPESFANTGMRQREGIVILEYRQLAFSRANYHGGN
jgi:hypothetical protein